MHAHVSICVRLFLGDILDTALSNLESFSLLKAHSWYHFPLLLFKNCIYFFYWRKIALQNFFVLCQTSTWISYRYTCIPSLLKLHPIFVPTSPLQVDTGPLIEFSEPFSKFLLAMYFTYGNVSLCPNQLCWRSWSWMVLWRSTRPFRTPKKDVLFIIGDWTAKVGSQEIPGVTGKFGLGIWNEAEQRLIEFCQENAGHSKHLLPTTQEKTLHMDITRWSTLKSDWLYSL